MSPFTVAILSFSMSADAFAASIARGAATRPDLKAAVRGGAVFGIVEAVTPVIGWALGLAAAGFVGAVDHWIAFILLGAIGGKMIWEGLSLSGEDDAATGSARRGLMTLIATAIATSIDAAAVGVTLALIGENIAVIALCIGLATFTMTTIGLTIGRKAGARLGSVVEVVGGLILIAIGTIILLEHTAVLR